MSGCYVPLLSNPDLPTCQFLFGVIGIFLSACWTIWHLFFYFKSPMAYQQDSSFFHHQFYQSIINQQSLPDCILEAFCSHWNCCSLPHLLPNIDSHPSPSSLSSAIAHLHLFQNSHVFHCILECTSLTLDVYNLGVLAGLISFKSDFFYYVK